MPTIVEATYPAAAAGLAEYARILSTDGVVKGLIGPREVPRLWERHLLNCAVAHELIPNGSSVADVGSGAGLPGLVLALVRPDLRITLVEPLLRRSDFLTDAVARLGLDHVEVVRARVEDLPRGTSFDVVTSRAVAALDKLARWCAPAVSPGGVMIALKGERADDELRAAAPSLRRLGLERGTVERIGAGIVDPPTTVVVLRKAPGPTSAARKPPGQRTQDRKARSGATRTNAPRKPR
jgi:16S rRNA (guanine527-N7)-methyltransferase